MKKYKDNYMFTFCFIMCNFLILTIPGLLIVVVFLNDGSIRLYEMFLLIALFIMLFVVFGNVINLLISLFTKHTVFIEDDMLIVRKIKKSTQKIKITDIKHIIFDHGAIGRTQCH